MPKLVKNKSLVDNHWQLLGDEDEITSTGHFILPLARFLSLAESGKLDYARHSCWLNSTDDIELLAPYVDKLNVIALQFEAFTDGRSFSQARSIRDHLEYEGELRACGHFIQDQVYYLSRCGIDAFELAEVADENAFIESLDDFSERYQGAADDPQPLFRRRV